MGPFEFIILFLSFIYTLALTHLLFAVTRMIRHRRLLVLSWPHSLWMLNALLLLSANWISLWDFHTFERLTLGIVVTGLLFSVFQYCLCGVVSPDFEDGESYDMRSFHAREGRTYILAFLVILLLSLIVNFGVGFGTGMQGWVDENWMVMAEILTTLLALLVRARWAQVAAPLLVSILMVAFMVVYYPALAR